MTFSVPINQVARAKKAMEDARDAGHIKYDDLNVDTDVAKVSVVGIGMRSHAGVAAKMFAALAAENVNIKVIATSEIKISVLIDRKYMELAVQALHDTLSLAVPSLPPSPSRITVNASTAASVACVAAPAGSGRDAAETGSAAARSCASVSGPAFVLV